MPQGWPTGRDFDVWQTPTPGGVIRKFPRAQLRFHPQERATFQYYENVLVRDILGGAIRRIESLQRPWLEWKLRVSKRSYTGLHRIIGNEHGRHLVLDLGTSPHEYRGGQNQPMNNREALAILRFFEDRMKDPRSHPGAWGVNPAYVDIWEDWNAPILRYRKYRGTFKLSVQYSQVGTNLSIRAVPSTNVTNSIQPACKSNGNLKYALNGGSCTPQLGTNFM